MSKTSGRRTSRVFNPEFKPKVAWLRNISTSNSLARGDDFHNVFVKKRPHKMKSPVRFELTTASVIRRYATPAAVYNPAPLQTYSMALSYRG